MSDHKTLTAVFANSSQDSEGDDRLNKIRDILLGTHIRDFENRLGQLEQRVAENTQNLQEDMKHQLDTLEAYFEKEFSAVKELLNEEKRNRTEQSHEAEREKRFIEEKLEKTVHTLQALRESHQRERQEMVQNQRAAIEKLNQNLLEQSKKWMEQLQTRTQQIQEYMEKEKQRIQDSKVDKHTIANLLSELALRLNDEFKIES